MRIAIDASRTTVAVRTGTENYALQLIRALVALKSPHQFTLYFRDKPGPDLFPPSPKIQQKVIPSRRLWTHLRFAAALWQDRPDVTFVPAHALPFIFPGHAVATVHDLGYRYFPDAHPAFERRYLGLTTFTSSLRATRILADSMATQRDLERYYHIRDSKIDIVYPGVENLKRATEAEITTARTQYKLPQHYIMFLGTLQPRKNIIRLIEAFIQFLNETPTSDLSLVLAGKRGWLIEAPLKKLLDSLTPAQRERIIVTGYVEDRHVAALYSGALALVMPSLYEGFGFPVIEAMSCGTPVVCSNTSSLPELAGDAAILVDPLRVASIANGIAEVATNEAKRTLLIQKGKLQAAQFTWERAARQTLDTLEWAAKGK
jgi:glycosyltransferase involved in cell wall biosynthesis